MIELEQRLQQRFPHWFRGRRASIARPLLRRIERWSRLLAFGVDPDFSDAVDGLIEVDIARMRPKKRQRYLGDASPPAEAAA